MPLPLYPGTLICEVHLGNPGEYYYWLVNIDPSKSDSLTLSNDNLASAADSDSVLVVKPDGGDAEIVGSDMAEKIVAQVNSQKAAAKAAEEERMAHETQFFADNPEMAQTRAVELHPDLGVKDSQFNKEFLARVAKYKKESPDYFKNPRRPIQLADEVASALKQ